MLIEIKQAMIVLHLSLPVFLCTLRMDKGGVLWRGQHIDHVMTQLAYAIVVAFISLVGFLVLGFTESMLLGLLATLFTFLLVMIILKRLINPIEAWKDATSYSFV